MKKRDFETYQKRFRDFEILPKFSETHVFRGTIRHPFNSIPNILIVLTSKNVSSIYSITKVCAPPWSLQHKL